MSVLKEIPVKRTIGLMFCAALLAGCGGDDQQYAECTKKQKRQMRGTLLIKDSGVNRGKCADLRTDSDSHINSHVIKRAEELNQKTSYNNSLCQMTNHKGSDWLCIYTAY